MHIVDNFHDGRLSPVQGGDFLTPDIVNQLHSQRSRHRRDLLLRTANFWWYRILLLILASFIAAILGRSILDHPREVLGGMIALPFLFLAIRHLKFGLLLTAILAESNLPMAFSVKTLDIYPVVLLFLIPLICFVVTTASLSKNDRWVEYIQHTFLILALGAAVVVILDFKRVGADVYQYRFVEPTIGWMNLWSLAPVIGLGSIIVYARLLYANHWRIRCWYAGILLVCLAGVYFTLYNSEWILIIVALMVMTLIYSFRLFLSCCVVILPFVPLLKSTIDKLLSVKSDDFVRLIVWQDALRIWSKYPWLGVGPGNLWIYDQYFTQLPLTLRNLNTTGLGVSHNGYLQVLGELGLVGLFFWLALIIVIIFTAARLYHYSNTLKTRNDRILALVGLGLICGSAVADFFSGSFLLPPRQLGSFDELPLLIAPWIIFGCIAYKDQLWKRVHNG